MNEPTAPPETSLAPCRPTAAPSGADTLKLAPSAPATAPRVNWRVEITREAKKELARLPGPEQVRIAKAILALEQDPFPRGCKKLKNRDGWRIRVGDYRALYFGDTEARQIVVGVIGHRREVYR